MNKLQTPTALRQLAVAILAATILIGVGACSGGGDGTNKETFTLSFVEPAQSLDLNGGRIVTIHGSNFNAANVLIVRFGDSPGQIQEKFDDRITVIVPPSPSGQAGRVNVEVQTLNFNTKGIFAGFEYVGGGATVFPPQPATITPTVYTATGAEQFRIAGTNLGVDGTEVVVTFEDVGQVKAVISGAGTFAVGNAPVSTTIPSGSLKAVTIENSAGSADVPTKVTYAYTSPSFLPVPYQEGANGASRPVRVAAGIAIMATAGTDASWGLNGNDEVYLIKGPPNVESVTPLISGQIGNYRKLDPKNSIPVVLDSDTVVIFTHGATKTQGDEIFLLITNLRTTPQVSVIAAPFATRAPLARISSTRIAYIKGGQGALGQDELIVLDIVSGVHTASYGPIAVGTADRNALRGRSNKSIPFSPDGDSIFVWSSGGNTVYGDGNDVLYRYKVSTAETAQTVAPHMVISPVALSASQVVGASAPLSNPPSLFDSLVVFKIPDNSFTRTLTALNSNVDAPPGGITPIQAFGNGHFALLVGGPDGAPNTPDDLVAIFLDDGAGGLTRADMSMGKRPTMTAAANGTLLVFGRGANNVLGDFDDKVRAINPAQSQNAEFVAGPPWQHGFPALTDDRRAFAIGMGQDQAWASGDEELFVYQTIAAGLGPDAATLPLAIDVFTPVANSLPFVPIGPGWGIIQSPGSNRVFLGTDDRVLIVRY